MNVRWPLAPLAGAVLALAAAACSAQAGGAAPATAGRPRLVFFMNPNGMPCQMQDRILRDMSPELGGKVDVVYYRTTERAELAEFGRFGIRALPTLVLTDATGRELRRAPPGIQSAEQVRQLVGG